MRKLDDDLNDDGPGGVPTLNVAIIISCGRGEDGVRGNDEAIAPGIVSAPTPIAALNSSITFRCRLDSMSDAGGCTDVKLLNEAGPPTAVDPDAISTGALVVVVVADGIVAIVGDMLTRGVCRSPSLTI